MRENETLDMLQGLFQVIAEMPDSCVRPSEAKLSGHCSLSYAQSHPTLHDLSATVINSVILPVGVQPTRI